MAEFQKQTIQYKSSQADTQWNNMPIEADTSSLITFSLMEETVLQLKSQIYGRDVPTYQFFKPFLTKIDTHSGTFYLTEHPKITKISQNNYTCEMFFKMEEYKLSFYKYKDLDGRLTFSLTSRIDDFLFLIKTVMNAKDTNWDYIIDYVAEYATIEKTISFDGNTCREALKMICEAFNVEFVIVGKQIEIYNRIEYFKDYPLDVHYGEMRGLLSEIVVDSAKTQMIEILYAHGGTRNIDPSKNNNINYLLLPKSQTIYYNGNDFLYPGYSGSTQFPEPIPDGYRMYITDSNGLFITRDDLKILSGYEDVFVSEDVYPKRIGDVTNVIPHSQHLTNNIYYFEDNTIPPSLDYSSPNIRIIGEKMTVKFESGNLAGLEFELPQSSTTVTGYIHSKRQFQPDPLNKDGQTYPNQTACINIGDKYAVFGMSMPPQYICDNKTRTGASWDLYREAVQYLYDKENGEVIVQIKIDPVYAKIGWKNVAPLSVVDYIKIGAYFVLKDKEIVGEELKVRVLGIKQNLFYKEKIELILSNTYLRKNYRTVIDGRLIRIIVGEKEKVEELREISAEVTFIKKSSKSIMSAFKSEEDVGSFVESGDTMLLPPGVRLTTLEDNNLDFVWTGEKLKPITGIVKLLDNENILSFNVDNQLVTSLSVKEHHTEDDFLLSHTITGKNNVIDIIKNEWIFISIEKTAVNDTVEVLTNVLKKEVKEATFYYKENGNENNIKITSDEFLVKGLLLDTIYHCKIIADVINYGKMSSKEYMFKTNK